LLGPASKESVMATLLDTINLIIQFIDCRQYSMNSDGGIPTLSPEEFEYLSELLDVALEHNPEDALLWFWRGWVDQMLEVRPDWRHPHPNFEKVEEAYSRALTIQPNHGPAAMMLTVLYLDAALLNAAWRTARGADFASWDEVLTIAGPQIDREAALKALRARRGGVENSPEPGVDSARKSTARSIVWGERPRPSVDELAEAQKYASMWLTGSGREIVARVYLATWVYDEEPVVAFHTDYIGWLDIVEDVVGYFVPNGQARRLLYELTDAWVEDSNHPVRGEFYERALSTDIDDPSAYFDCLTKAILYLSASRSDYDAILPDLITIALQWLQDSAHQTIRNYSMLESEFRLALATAIRALDAELTAAAVVEAVTDSQATAETIRDETALRTLIATREGQHVEFKPSLRWSYRESRIDKSLGEPVMKTLAAFMNSYGGRLLIGVADTGDILGVEQDWNTLGKPGPDGYENHFSQEFHKMIGAEYREYVQLSFVTIEGKTVCVVDVQRAKEPAYLTRGNGEEVFYIRSGNASQPLSLRQVQGYIARHFSPEQSGEVPPRK
jgi:hypothetical protein